MKLTLSCSNIVKINGTTLEVVVVIFLGILNKGLCRFKNVSMIDLRDDISVPLLSCWVCLHTRSSPDVNCVEGNQHNVTKIVCGLHEPFCKTQCLEDGSKLERFHRSCSNECRPGCTKFESIQHCEWCCTQPLCNDHNYASSDISKSMITVLFISTIFQILMC